MTSSAPKMFKLALELTQEDPALLARCFCFLFNPNKFHGTATKTSEVRVAGAEGNQLEEDRQKIERSVLSGISTRWYCAYFGNHTLSRKESM